MNILEQIAAKAERGDTGMSLHYGFLYSCIVGMESKNVFEFGSGFSTHVILHDGSHVGEEVLVDLNNIYPYLKHDGILITHDTRHATLGEGMREAVEEFAKGKDLETCTIPYGYGLTFFRNKGNIDNPVNLSWRKR